MSALTYPDIIPIFPLGGTILLPQAVLPLHIFEPRYKQMVEKAMERDSFIGMIQPVGEEGEEVHTIGCLGKIEQFQQLPNSNYLVQLHGVLRFMLVGELNVDTMYRQAQVDYSPFLVDLDEPRPPEKFEDLQRAFREYVERKQLQIEWDKIENIPSHFLVNILCMNLDFSGLEKQALLESPDLGARMENLVTLLEMAVAEDPHDDSFSYQLN